MARQLKSGDRFFRGKMVRLLSENNEQLGMMSFEEAISRANAAGLDLVEMASKVDPPVCKIMDFGKFQYQENRRQREAKKKQVQGKVKEMKLRPDIDEHDLGIKIKQGIEFLEKGDKLKLRIAFDGREMAHLNIGEDLAKRVIAAMADVSMVDSAPKLMGRNIFALLTPKSQAAKAQAAKAAKAAQHEGESQEN